MASALPTYQRKSQAGHSDLSEQDANERDLAKMQRKVARWQRAQVSKDAFGVFYNEKPGWTTYVGIFGAALLATTILSFVLTATHVVTAGGTVGSTLLTRAFITTISYAAVSYMSLAYTGGLLQPITTIAAFLYHAIFAKHLTVKMDCPNIGAAAFHWGHGAGVLLLLLAAQFGGYVAGPALVAAMNGSSLAYGAGVDNLPALASQVRGMFGESILAVILVVAAANMRDSSADYNWPLTFGLIHGISTVALKTVSHGPVNMFLQIGSSLILAAGPAALAGSNLGVVYIAGPLIGLGVGLVVAWLLLLWRSSHSNGLMPGEIEARGGRGIGLQNMLYTRRQ